MYIYLNINIFPVYANLNYVVVNINKNSIVVILMSTWTLCQPILRSQQTLSLCHLTLLIYIFKYRCIKEINFMSTCYLCQKSYTYTYLTSYIDNCPGTRSWLVMVSLCHCATVQLCHCATMPLCHCATVPGHLGK